MARDALARSRLRRPRQTYCRMGYCVVGQLEVTRAAGGVFLQSVQRLKRLPATLRFVAARPRAHGCCHCYRQQNRLALRQR